MEKTILVQTIINSPIDKVWELYTTPKDIMQWNNASPDWHTPHAENDFKVGGKFIYRMEAKDGSFGFDFWGTYDSIKINERIDYTIGDGRKVKVTFSSQETKTKVVIEFEAEETNSIEMQKDGWQAILNHFKKYVEMN